MTYHVKLLIINITWTLKFKLILPHKNVLLDLML